MKIKDYTCKCGNDIFFMSGNNNQIGIYCSKCGKWLKWADKDEKNLLLKSKSVPMENIDRIIEEIEAYNSQLIDKNVVLDKINKYCKGE